MDALCVGQLVAFESWSKGFAGLACISSCWQGIGNIHAVTGLGHGTLDRA